MKSFLFAFLLFGLPACLCAQNLVPNPSFEDTVTVYVDSIEINCPDNLSGITSNYDFVRIAKGWSSFRPSPDYYNSCSNIMGVPSNLSGYQYAASGNAYCGIFTYEGYTKNYREFIGCKLLSQLFIGNKYFVNFKVSKAEGLNCASNNIGVSFSTVKYSDSLQAPLNNNPKVFSHSIISDTVNWVNISGSFIADSAYNYIIIGNFFQDILTDTIPLSPPSPCEAYYFIDDICVSQDSLGCDLNNDGINKITNGNIRIYPNPAKDKLFINATSVEELSVALINLIGQTFKEFSKQSIIDVSEIPDGIYIVEIKYQGKVIQKKQVIIH